MPTKIGLDTIYCLQIASTGEVMLDPSATTMVETESVKVIAVVDTDATANFFSLNIVNNLDDSKDTFKFKHLKKRITVNITNYDPLWVYKMICVVIEGEQTIIDVNS